MRNKLQVLENVRAERRPKGTSESSAKNKKNTKTKKIEASVLEVGGNSEFWAVWVALCGGFLGGEGRPRGRSGKGTVR